jgi:hypothetical protein
MNLLIEKYVVSKLNTQFYLNNNYISIDNEFKYVYETIKKALDKCDNPTCFQYCETILNYIDMNNINCPGDILFRIYFCYYISSFYYKRDKSKEIVDKIFYLCKTNNNFNNTYLNSKDFYDQQFKFVMI